MKKLVLILALFVALGFAFPALASSKCFYVGDKDYKNDPTIPLDTLCMEQLSNGQYAFNVTAAKEAAPWMALQLNLDKTEILDGYALQIFGGHKPMKTLLQANGDVNLQLRLRTDNQGKQYGYLALPGWSYDIWEK